MLYLRRFVWFVAKWLLGVTIALGVLVCAFYMCLNTANIYIVLNDGLEKRVDVILTQDDAQELNNYFHHDFLNADPALAGAFNGSAVYSDYVISDFEYKLTIERLWAWPWDEYATCSVVERVPRIEGKVRSSRKNEVSAEIPAWQGGRYDLTLVRSGGKWKIIGMQQTAILMEAETEAE